MRLTRRRFFQSTLATAATVTVAGTKSSGKVLGANDTVRVGVAGLNGRGHSHTDAFLGTNNEGGPVLMLMKENGVLRHVWELREKEVGAGRAFFDGRYLWLVRNGGANLFAANYTDGTITQFAVDQETGALTFTGNRTEVPFPFAIAISD